MLKHNWDTDLSWMRLEPDKTLALRLVVELGLGWGLVLGLGLRLRPS